jgi:serine protease Do
VTVWIGDEEQEATFVAHDKQLGLSIVQVKSERKLTPLTMVPKPDVAIGQWLAVLSTTGEDAYFTPRTGLFMICGRRPTRYPEFEIDGIGNPTTGAPLLDRRGRAIAIAKSKTIATALSPAFCSDLSQFIERSIAGESEDSDKDKAYLGACLQAITTDHARFLDVDKSALWVTHVLPDSPAAKAGLEEGDLILAFDGETIRYSGNRARSDFNWRLERKKKAPFTLKVWRNGTTTVLDCQREDRPEPKEFESKELGVVVSEIDENIYAHRNLTERKGVVVSTVRSGSPASTSSKFGQSLIGKNDVIMELNGLPTPDIESFTKAAEEIRRVGPSAVLVKYRRGRVTGFAGLNLNIGSTTNGAEQ